MKRKLLSAILALCMVFCLLPTFALAGDGTTSTPVYPAGITADDFASANAFYLNGLNESVSGAAVAVFINGSGNLEYVADIRTAAIMGATEIWCLENADMRARATDTNRTEPLTADLTIHGNGANFNGGQINISASSNEGDVTLVIENAKNLSVWGNPGSTGRTYHVTMRNCAVEKDSGEGLVMWRGSSSNTDKIDLLVEDCYLKSTGSTPMDGIHTTAGGSVTVRNSTFEGNANAINLSNKTDDAMTLVVENTAFDG